MIVSSFGLAPLASKRRAPSFLILTDLVPRFGKMSLSEIRGKWNTCLIIIFGLRFLHFDSFYEMSDGISRVPTLRIMWNFVLFYLICIVNKPRVTWTEILVLTFTHTHVKSNARDVSGANYGSINSFLLQISVRQNIGNGWWWGKVWDGRNLSKRCLHSEDGYYEPLRFSVSHQQLSPGMLGTRSLHDGKLVLLQ